LKSYWTLRENDEGDEEDGAAAAGGAAPPEAGAPNNLPQHQHILRPDIGPIDINIEVQNGRHIGGMLHLGEDHEGESESEDQEEDQEMNEDEEEKNDSEDDPDLVVLEDVEEDQVENEEIFPEEFHQEAEDSDQEEHEPDEDDIEDMFELAQAVVNRARENDPQNQVPPPLPPPLPPPINRNPVPNNEGGPAGRPQMDRGVENVDVEVQINLDVIGLRGPLFGVLIYCAWLAIFNFFCILIGAVAPITLKKIFFHATVFGKFDLTAYFSQLISSHWIADTTIYEMLGDNWQTFSSSLRLFNLLLQPTEPNQIFRLVDIIDITLGYILFSIFLYLLNSVVFVLARAIYGPSTVNPRIPTSIQFSLTYLPRAVDIIKIGTLMTIRIFWLPCVIGSIVILCFNLLFQIPLEELFLWSGNHIIGAVAMCWGVGIAYMLTTTISILQLREILHPDWLSRFIRPQESQVDLLTSLLLDPPLIQLRRLLLSFFVYAVLILIFVFIPIYISRYAMSWVLGAGLSGVIPPLPVHFWHLTPDLQIFLEIGFLHTYFLMVLEKKKDLIGHWEYFGLKYLTQQLGISRYILPYAMKIISVSQQTLSLSLSLCFSLSL
jgi:hypothetical protein